MMRRRISTIQPTNRCEVKCNQPFLHKWIWIDRLIAFDPKHSLQLTKGRAALSGAGTFCSRDRTWALGLSCRKSRWLLIYDRKPPARIWAAGVQKKGLMQAYEYTPCDLDTFSTLRMFKLIHSLPNAQENPSPLPNAHREKNGTLPPPLYIATPHIT